MRIGAEFGARLGTHARREISQPYRLFPQIALQKATHSNCMTDGSVPLQQAGSDPRRLARTQRFIQVLGKPVLNRDARPQLCSQCWTSLDNFSDRIGGRRRCGKITLLLHRGTHSHQGRSQWDCMRASDSRISCREIDRTSVGT